MRAFIHSLLLPLLFLSTSTLFAQVIGGRGNGQQAPTEAKASELSKGGVSGDVNLFNGTFGTSYDLGTVTTVGGLSYTATMSYSSSFASGNNLPNTAGVPYGEGWNVDVPMINISTEDYNQYNLQEMLDFNTSHYDLSAGPINFDHDYDEGKLLWYAPTLNIPGVASGRMVYKYTDRNNNAIFVLHKFERYIEAKFTGSGWEVLLDDGTVYHFYVRQGQQRNANNRRLAGAPSSLGSQIVPKVEVTAWYANKISHPNKEGKIYFTYNTFGKFDQFKEFKQHRLAQAIQVNTCGSPISEPKLMWSVFKDVSLKTIEAHTEKIEFNYQSILNPGVATDRFDSLYTKEVIATWDSNFNTWKRYKHLKADGPYDESGNRTFNIGHNNPYVGYTGTTPPGNGERYMYEENVTSNHDAAFNHGFLESPLIDYNVAGKELPVGDMYELRVEIGNPIGLSCNFDINVVAGDNVNVQQEYHLNTPYPLTNSWNQRRSETVFTTFNQAVKWNTTANNPNQNTLQTSNFFTMPNLLPEYGGVRIQVGPGNADVDYALDSRDTYTIAVDPQGNMNNSHAYYENYPSSILQPGHLKKGHNVTPNFGIGLPWYMVGDLYYQGSTMNDYYESDNPQSPHGHEFWWENDRDNDVINPYDNVPTLADENFKIKKVELIRYKKNPYMLHSVRHVKLNGYDAQIIDHNNWKTTQKHAFEYEEATLPHFSVYKDTVHTGNGILDFPTTSIDFARNRTIYLLKNIKQMPIQENVDFNIDDLPTTHFDYDSTAFIGITGFPEDYHEYVGNTNHVLLTGITDPLGKETRITYQEHPKTLTNFSYKWRPRPPVTTIPMTDNTRKPWIPFSSTIYYQVLNKTITDANGTRQWDYEYIDMRYFNDGLTLPLNIAWDASHKPSYGFSQTIVTGPELTSGNRPYDIYYHHNLHSNVNLDEPYSTGESLGVLRGKLYRIEKYDGQDNMLSKTITRHDYHKAFVRGRQRQNMILTTLET